MKKRITSVLLIVVLITFILIMSSHIISNNPVSDASFYALATEKITSTGYIQSQIDKIPGSSGGFSINYPSLFFVNNGLNLILIGTLAPLKIASFFLFIVFSFLIFNKRMKLKFSTSVLLSTITCLTYGTLYYFFVHQKQEFIFITFLITTIYYFLSGDSKHLPVLILIAIFLAFLVGTKQLALIPLFFFLVFILLDKRITLKTKGAFFLIIFLLILPVSGDFFFRTCTLTFPNANLGPISKIEKNACNLFGIQIYEEDSDWKNLNENTTIQQSREQNKYDQLTDIIFGSKITKIGIIILLSILIGLGSFVNIKRDFSMLSIVLIVGTCLFVFIKITSIPQYFVFLPPLVLILIAPSLEIIEKKISKQTRSIILFCLVAIFFILFIPNLEKLVDSKERIDSQVIIYSYPLLYEGNILSSRTYELALYQDRKIYWFNLYGNFELYNILSNYDSNRLVDYMKNNDITYIYVPKFAITRESFSTGWIGYIPQELVDNLNKDNKFVKEVEDDGVLIYRLKELSSSTLDTKIELK